MGGQKKKKKVDKLDHLNNRNRKTFFHFNLIQEILYVLYRQRSIFQCHVFIKESLQKQLMGSSIILFN